MKHFAFTMVLGCACPALGADYPQWGKSPERNNVIEGTDAKAVPLTWNVGEFDSGTGAWKPEKSKHIKWVARLGGNSFGNPTVAGGKIFVPGDP